MVARQSPKLPDITPKKCHLDSTKGNGRRPVSRSSRMSEVSWGTDDTDMSECICTICDCGKHACPLHKWKPTEFGGNSRYREDYPEHPLAGSRRLPANHKVELTPANPDHFKSKYDEDFQAYNPDPAKSMKPKERAIESVPFSSTTTNHEMYTPKKLSMRNSKRPKSPPRNAVPFDATTTNHEHFQAYEGVKPRDSMAPAQRMLQTSPFDGHTAYRDDYPVHDVAGCKKKAPDHSPYDYGPPRGLATEQRIAFNEKPLHLCPALFLPKKEPSTKTGHIHYTKKHDNPNAQFSPTKTL